MFRGILSYLRVPFNEGRIKIDISTEGGVGEGQGEKNGGLRRRWRERAARPRGLPAIFGSISCRRTALR